MRLIHHAYNHVDFYTKTFKSIGIRPEDIRSIEDLKYLPIIDKKVFHQGKISEFLDNRIKNTNRLHNIKTSGTSGTMLSFYIDRKYDQLRKALYLRPYLSNGRKITDKVLRLSIFGQSKKKNWFQRIGLMREETVDSCDDIYRQIEKIRNFRPSIIQGYGSALSLIASKILEEKIDLPSPRIVFTDSELLTPFLRKKIEIGFDAPVIDIYGTFETDNIAYQCPEYKGYHIAMDAIIMEFVKDGKIVKPGGKGEIVCTVLDNYAMPFIRYNLHDVACYIQDKCLCRRTLPLMSMLRGRSDDYLLYPDGQKKSPMRLLGHFDQLADSISEFQLIQKKINAFDVQIVLISSVSGELKEMIKKSIWKEFPDATVSVKFVNRIEREKSGKFSSIKSLID
jgi:phenylacetate-CoA ligase